MASTGAQALARKKRPPDHPRPTGPTDAATVAKTPRRPADRRRGLLERARRPGVDRETAVRVGGRVECLGKPRLPENVAGHGPELVGRHPVRPGLFQRQVPDILALLGGQDGPGHVAKTPSAGRRPKDVGPLGLVVLGREGRPVVDVPRPVVRPTTVDARLAAEGVAVVASATARTSGLVERPARPFAVVGQVAVAVGRPVWEKVATDLVAPVTPPAPVAVVKGEVGVGEVPGVAPVIVVVGLDAEVTGLVSGRVVRRDIQVRPTVDAVVGTGRPLRLPTGRSVRPVVGNVVVPVVVAGRLVETAKVVVVGVEPDGLVVADTVEGRRRLTRLGLVVPALRPSAAPEAEGEVVTDVAFLNSYGVAGTHGRRRVSPAKKYTIRAED